MKTYSIEKVGSDYVVKVDEQRVMKLGSRRRAAQLVVDASELLDEAPLAPEQPGDATALAEAMTGDDDASSISDESPISGDDSPPSIGRDSPEVA